MGDSLADKVMHRTAQVAVIGLGYVGLPLAVASTRERFTSTPTDVTVVLRTTEKAK